MENILLIFVFIICVVNQCQVIYGSGENAFGIGYSTCGEHNTIRGTQTEKTKVDVEFINAAGNIHVPGEIRQLSAFRPAGFGDLPQLVPI